MVRISSVFLSVYVCKYNFFDGLRQQKHFLYRSFFFPCDGVLCHFFSKKFVSLPKSSFICNEFV